MPRDRSDIARALTAKGFRLDQGSRDHDYFIFDHEGKTTPVYTKLSRGSKYKTIDDGLLRRISKQLHLTSRQFDDLVQCPMDEPAYIAALTDRGVLRGG